jgi:hypothetical protein
MADDGPPRLGKDFNPANAKWCDEHENIPGRLECTKHRTKGRGACHAPAIRGTDACRIHGGIRAVVAKTKGKAEIITAWSAVGDPVDGRNTDPGMAVLGMLQTAWLRAAVYGELLRRQVVSEGGVIEIPEISDGRAVKPTGLIGYRFGAAGRDGNIFAQSEEVRALVMLEAAERDRVVKYAKVAHDMGISDRLTSLAERWGDLVVTRIMVVIEALNLTPEQEARVPQLIQAHLGQIEIGSGAGPGS